MKASDLFIQALENEGVEYIFGIPGEENLDLLESLRKSKKIKLILTRHEQGAAFMAATYGRLTGKAGVCLATLGPGATNFTTPAAYGFLGGFPLVMITGQKPIKKSKQGQFQIIDVVQLFAPICKMTKQIVNANTIPSLVREAFRVAEEEKPGPVLLELPEDIAEEPADMVDLIPPGERHYAIAGTNIIQTAAEAIKNAKRPLLLIGAGANRKEARRAISDFIGMIGVPFCNTQMGKGVVDESSSYFLGTAALSDKDYLHDYIKVSDLIVNIGHDVVEKPPFFMEHGGTKVIHVNYKSAQVDQVYFPQIEVVGDIALSVDALAAALGSKLDIDLGDFEKVRDNVKENIFRLAEEPTFPMRPQEIVSEIRNLMGYHDIIALDNGVYKIWFARNYLAFQPNTILLDNALATMGAGLPSAMLAALIHPNRKVMSICGDGGFMMNSQEIETAVRLNLNLVVLILNDNSYGMIRWKQAGSGFADWGLEYNNPDFVKYAESYGAHGHSITSVNGFIETVDRAYRQGGVHLIDLPVDYSQNVKELITDLRDHQSVV
ncbi:acetolactate synthase large subunit [Alphaproteobacteria bacterium]|nr:acetolactate synthase large subunit [Alphaproteobacteria bacterium]MDB3936741.1 acetolactate synthase large subunit [bacterium]